MQAHLIAIRYADGTKALFRVNYVDSFAEAHRAAMDIGVPVALVLVQPVACAVEEAA